MTTTLKIETCARGHLLDDENTEAPLLLGTLAYTLPECLICKRTAEIQARATATNREHMKFRKSYAVSIKNEKGLDVCPRDGCGCQVVLTGDREDPIRGLWCGWRPLANLNGDTA